MQESSNVTVSNKYYHPLELTPNPCQTICFAINELEDLVKEKPTDNNVKALELLKEALSLL
jgi:hypothetical protein